MFVFWNKSFAESSFSTVLSPAEHIQAFHSNAIYGLFQTLTCSRTLTHASLAFVSQIAVCDCVSASVVFQLPVFSVFNTDVFSFPVLCFLTAVHQDEIMVRSLRVYHSN